MSDDSEPLNDTQNSYGKATGINALSLGMFAIITAFVLGTTFVATKDRIDEAQRLADQKALLEVMGDTPYDNDILDSQISFTASENDLFNTTTDQRIYVIRYQGDVSGFIFPAVTPEGYSGDISMLIGVDTVGQVLGVRITEHKETPGLGDKVDVRKNNWVLDFAGTSLGNPTADQWAVKKDGGQFDAFTGATITPRAVVNRLKTVLDYYQGAAPDLVHRAQNTSVIEE